MTKRKRKKSEKKQFNMKLEDTSTWNDKFDYPFISEILEVCFPKVNVSHQIFSFHSIFHKTYLIPISKRMIAELRISHDS